MWKVSNWICFQSNSNVNLFVDFKSLFSIPQVCSKDGPPLPLDKQLCRPFQSWTLFRLSHICCSGVLTSIFRMINYYHLMSSATLSVTILIMIKLQVQSFHCVLKHEPLLWAQQKLVPVLWNRSFSFFLLYLAFVHILLCEIIKYFQDKSQLWC